MCTVFTNQPTNKTTHMQSAQTKYVGAVHTHNLPNETVGADIHAQLSQAKCVGAVPACPPERPCSGVSIPKYIYASRIMHEDLTMDAPLWGDTGGHTGTAPTHLHHIFPRNPIQTK